MSNELEPIEIRYRDMGDLDGAWDPDTRTIWLHHDLSAAEHRCTLTHELLHAIRGDERCHDDVLNSRQERLVERLAAQILIPLDRLADALAWSQDDTQVAEALHVDEQTVRRRREHLTADETAHLEARIALIEHAA